MSVRTRIAITVAAASLLAAPVSAQTRRSASKATHVTVSVSGGVQQAANDVSDHFSFPKNVETETIDVKYPMKPWALVDVGAGFRLWKNIGVGIAVSHASGNGRADVTASVPHPFFFNQLRTVTGTENGIVHGETGVHLELQYLVPATGRLHFVLEGGPSWLNVDHEIVTDITVTESYPYDTAAFGGAVTKTTTASAAGFNAGIDVSWMFARSVGVGGLVRYTRADVDLEPIQGRSLAMKAGGVQAGIGIRVVF
jgi:hypothetical protein